jgi:hypothetical protein
VIYLYCTVSCISALPFTVAARFKAFCGCSPAEVVGSNHTGGMDVSLLGILGVVW